MIILLEIINRKTIQTAKTNYFIFISNYEFFTFYYIYPLWEYSLPIYLFNEMCPLKSTCLPRTSYRNIHKRLFMSQSHTKKCVQKQNCHIFFFKKKGIFSFFPKKKVIFFFFHSSGKKYGIFTHSLDFW